MLKDKTKNLAELITQNPDLPIVFMVDNSECLSEDEYPTTVHCPYLSKVDKIAHYGQAFYDDVYELREAIEYELDGDEVSYDEFKRIVDEIFNDIVWYEAIIVETGALLTKWLEE